MRPIRTDEPQPEMWEEADIMAYLGCDETKAKQIMKECRKLHDISGYGPIEKALLLDFIEEKQREQRQREARHQADIATAESFAMLKEQVKILQKVCDSSSEDARKARTQSIIANFIAGISIAIAIISLVLKVV
ncbi:MAG: hypothetical protein HDR93_01440 [Bacteroides sp.]|nr:hypothetical protein [Bacteroides sp.]